MMRQFIKVFHLRVGDSTAHTVSQFIFEELLCRYGVIAEIVTDNGPEVKGATKELL